MTSTLPEVPSINCSFVSGDGSRQIDANKKNNPLKTERSSDWTGNSEALIHGLNIVCKIKSEIILTQ